MSDTHELLHAAERTLFLEGHYLDNQQWSDWLELFTPDVVYWVPSWKSEHEPTASPDSELSLIYYTGRNGLEDRIVRATSGLSPASVPLARTVHMTANLFLASTGADLLEVRSSWATHLYQPKNRSAGVIFGRGEHQLRRVDGAWRIARKKTIVVSEVLPSSIDFYQL